MREIKFRAFGSQGQGMFEVKQLDFTNMSCNGVTNCKLMQFTGLHDKNGKEIYEGDVLKREGEVGVVRWDDSLGRFRVYMDDNNPMPRNYPLWFELIEVIGNIYENPELAGRTE